MKKTIAMIMSVGMTCGVASADLLIDETFAYADGPLNGQTPSVGGAWSSISGTANEILVAGGQITLSDALSEDVSSSFAAVSSGSIYFGLDLIVTDPGNYTGTDFEYFTNFDTSAGFKARTDIAAFSATGYRLGIATGAATAESIWSADLAYGSNQRVVVGYDFVSGLATLWVNATTESDTSISSTTSQTGFTVDGLIFRQSSATPDQNIAVDNLRVATTFAEAVNVVPEPATISMLLLGLVGARGMIHRRKRS